MTTLLIQNEVDHALAGRVAVEVRLPFVEGRAIGVWAVNRRDYHGLETCLGAIVSAGDGSYELRDNGAVVATGTDLANLAMIAAERSNRSAAFIPWLRSDMADDPYFEPDFIRADGRRYCWSETVALGFRPE